MLVLSRREKEKIVFPNLGITVELLRSKGKVAQLGIDAPQDVKVLREEVYQRQGGKDSEPMARSTDHELRNQLNSLSLTLQVIQKRLARGDDLDVESVLGSVIDQLKSLDRGFPPATTSMSAELQTPQIAGTPAARSALLVDDSVNERTLMAELLQQSGFDVYTVPDGEQAMEYLRNCRQLPDFVLLDMCMPNMNGVETVAEIRSDPVLTKARFKLFAVSGADRNELQIDIGPAGVDRWFSKPVDAKSLIREMNSELQCA